MSFYPFLSLPVSGSYVFLYLKAEKLNNRSLMAVMNPLQPRSRGQQQLLGALS